MCANSLGMIWLGFFFRPWGAAYHVACVFCAGAVARPPTPKYGIWCCAVSCVLLCGAAVLWGLFCVVRGVSLCCVVPCWYAGALPSGMLWCCAVRFLACRLPSTLAALFLSVWGSALLLHTVCCCVSSCVVLCAVVSSLVLSVVVVSCVVCVLLHCAASCLLCPVVLLYSPGPAAALVVWMSPASCPVVPFPAVCVVLCWAVLCWFACVLLFGAGSICAVFWCRVVWCIAVCFAVSSGVRWCGGAALLCDVVWSVVVPAALCCVLWCCAALWCCAVGLCRAFSCAVCGCFSSYL